MSREDQELYESRECHPSIIKKYSGDMTVEKAETIIIAALFTSAVYAYDIIHYCKATGFTSGMLSQKHMVSKDAALSFSILTLFFHFQGKMPMVYEFNDKVTQKGFKISYKFLAAVRTIVNFRRVVNRKNIISACDFLRKHYETSWKDKPFFYYTQEEFGCE